MSAPMDATQHITDLHRRLDEANRAIDDLQVTASRRRMKLDTVWRMVTYRNENGEVPVQDILQLCDPHDQDE